MFTIRIYDEENNQIGMFENIVDVPRGLILAEGYVAGYHAGIVEGNRCMYQRRMLCNERGTESTDPLIISGVSAYPIPP